MEKDFRVAQGNVLVYENQKELKEITKEIVELLSKKDISVGMTRAILKDAINTVDSISNEKKL